MDEIDPRLRALESQLLTPHQQLEYRLAEEIFQSGLGDVEIEAALRDLLQTFMDVRSQPGCPSL